MPNQRLPLLSLKMVYTSYGLYLMFGYLERGYFAIMLVAGLGLGEFQAVQRFAVIAIHRAGILSTREPQIVRLQFPVRRQADYFPRRSTC